jgi:hypothetical protein
MNHMCDLLFTAAIAAVALPACMTGSSGDELPGNSKLTGNGAPSGPHFDLNIIGVPKDKSPKLGGGDGHRIFVPLSGTTKINLSEGDFAVLDANATDGTGAFQLPNPDPDGDGVTSYSVFARALGTPGGPATITTCATDPTTGDLVCSNLSTLLVRSKGGSKFTNVSKELLFVVADVNGDGTLDKVPLFDDRLQDFFWGFDNNGLRLAQLRFYDVPTNTN